MTQETGATGSGRAGGSSGGETMQQSASMLADQAGRTAEAQASKLMTQAGDSLEQVARAVRDVGQGVREEQPAIADFAETAAHQVERAAQFLHEHDAAEVVEAGSNYARRQPALLVGGGLLLGLALGRMLKTAGRHTDGGGYMGGYGGGRQYGTGSGQYGSGSTGYGAGSGAYGSGSTGYGAGSTGYGTGSGARGSAGSMGTAGAGAAGSIASPGSGTGSAGSMGTAGGTGTAGTRSMDATDPLATGAVVDETASSRDRES